MRHDEESGHYDITAGTSVNMDDETIGLEEFAKWEAELEKLREPFPPERIEKLPKPLYKGAWDGERKGQCPECGGYHVIANTIHLDYVGHANCTDRLLEVDSTWNWEPLAYTPEGLPLFDRSGGLWIKLTVCGVERLGYGDGSSVKEVIGDAIRNAAMRFGVALDLWAKINLHEERNPGDGPTQQRSSGQQRQPDAPYGRAGAGGSVPASRSSDRGAASAPRPNQDALDSLGSVCDENGYDRRTMRDRYAEWVGEQSVADTSVKVTDLLDAPSEYIIAFAAHLIAILDQPEEEAGGGGEAGEEGTADGDKNAAEPAAADDGPADAADAEGVRGDEAQTSF